MTESAIVNEEEVKPSLSSVAICTILLQSGRLHGMAQSGRISRSAEVPDFHA
jgi:hypothetical protein